LPLKRLGYKSKPQIGSGQPRLLQRFYQPLFSSNANPREAARLNIEEV
jgi:hypothetical protein